MQIYEFKGPEFYNCYIDHKDLLEKFPNVKIKIIEGGIAFCFYNEQIDKKDLAQFIWIDN